MTGYISKLGYVIRKDCISREELENLKKELRGRPLQDEKYNFFNQKDTSFPLYIETKNKLYMPKMYAMAKFGKPNQELENYIGKRWNEDVIFRGDLYAEQKIPCQLLLRRLEEDGGGILALPTGGGKTVSALYVLANLKGKALIIVNKIALLKQWEQEIKKFLPLAQVGIIQGQNIDVEGKDIVLAMLQSLARIDYPNDTFEDFRVTLVDEIHNVSSPVFSKVLMKVCSKYTIGLSATPKRSDGCEYVFKWFIGDIVFHAKTERKGLTPIIKTIKIESNEYKEISSENKITGQKQIMFTSMLTDLIGMQKRNKLIIELVKHLVASENRKVLVLSDRREHLKMLKNYLDIDHVNFTYGMFIGQMKIKELEKSKACQVILATYQAFGEGVSEKDLNTLILATPKKFIGHLKNTVKNESGKLEQIVGRIFRKEHVVTAPLIVDLHDHFSVYKTQSKQRNVFYKEHFKNAKFDLQTVNLDEYEVSQITIDKMQQQTTRTPKPNADSDKLQVTSDIDYSLCMLE